MNNVDTIPVFRVRGGFGGYEWATICVHGWEDRRDGDIRYVGEILIHSSFGSWAYLWTNMGEPFHKFLLGAERDYVAVKFLGADAFVYDGEGSVKTFRKLVLGKRRDDALTNEYARAIWDFVRENESRMETSVRDFVEALEELEHELRQEMLGSPLPMQVAYLLDEPYEYTVTMLDPGFSGFWRELWPQFLNRLQLIADSPS